MIFLIKELGFTGWDAVIVTILLSLVFVISITLHEFAHAYVAVKMGDDTPRLQGRWTVNPVAHLDLMGSLCFILTGFGWAKPVQVNPLRFQKYRTGIAKVSLAGVTANLIICIVSSFFYVLFFNVLGLTSMFAIYVINFFSWLMQVNALLVVFNILPIYPLDGFNFLSTRLKPNNKYIDFCSKYGYLIIMILAITGAMTYVLNYSSYLYWPFIKLWQLFF